MNQLNFDKLNGLLPCIIQDAATQKVLMLGFMNAEAYTKTLNENRVTFYSRSKQKLWTKGETSGNYLDVVQILHDCDNDTLLIKANPKGPVCHTGADTCFKESNTGFNLRSLEKIIQDRKANPDNGSYTSSLFEAGLNKIAQKVGEEAVELVIEAKDQDQNKFLNEAADLAYHFLVLLTAKDVCLQQVEEVLSERHR